MKMDREVADRRDEITWVAIELTRQGEIHADEGTLEALLRRDLRVGVEHPIFVPTACFTRGGKTTTAHLMEGYVFVASGLTEIQYFELEKRPYIQQVMSSRTGPHRMRYVSVITNAHIEQMRLKLRQMIVAEILVGDEVLITDGQYRQLNGEVIGLEDEHAYVRIDLRSLKVVATIPRFFLEVQEPA